MLNEALAVCRAVVSVLLKLYNVPSNLPIGLHQCGVDGSGNMLLALCNETANAVNQLVVIDRHCHCIIFSRGV